MKTWLALKTEIQKECNIEAEEFISAAELLTWVNDAKDEAEAEIVSLQERYLETEQPLPVTAGVSIYNLPTDIYAAKVSGIYFGDGAIGYEIKPMYDKKQILRMTDTDYYQYRIINSAANGLQLKFYPAIRDTSATSITLHYIRKSKRIALDTDLMDIPLAEGFIKQFVKDKIKEKELGPISAGGRSAQLEKQKTLLVEALVQKTPDDSSDELRPDLGFYDMHDYDCGDYYGY